MNTARIERREILTGRGSPHIDHRGPIVVASIFAVFACFFAIGRATGAGSASRAEAPSSLPASVSAAIPIRLSGAPPIEISSAASAHERVNRRSRSISIRTASSPAQALAPEIPRAPLHSSPSVQPVSPPPEKAPPSPASVSPPIPQRIVEGRRWPFQAFRERWWLVRQLGLKRMHASGRSLPTAMAPVLAAVAILGYVAGHDRSRAASGEKSRTISAASVLLAYPSDWQPAAAAPGIPGLSIAHPVVLSPGGDAAHAGLLVGQLAGGEQSPLPMGFMARMRRLPDTEVVDLPETQAYRYARLSIPGFDRILSLYAIPNPGGQPNGPGLLRLSGVLGVHAHMRADRGHAHAGGTAAEL
jgi:hypothetical protein